MPARGRARRYGLLSYVAVALGLYVLYSLLTAKPRPPAGGAFMRGDLPVLDDSRGFAAVLPVSPKDQVDSEPGVALSDGNVLSSEQKQTLKESRLNHMERLVHLDLKGAAPKISYFESVFPLFRALGATGLLVEWEDSFPYDGELSPLAAGDCYSKEDVKRIYQLANESDLYIIPLIQTFGHMEFVLKGPEFKHLREHPNQPTVINPHKEESKRLIQMMIDQQMALQPDIQHMHIGADEVWALGNSDESKDQMERYGITKDVMFLNHVREVAGYLKNSYPLVEVMMWDDMFRSCNVKDVEKSRVNRLVTPVIWMYRTDTDLRLKPAMFQKYSKLFRTVWIGTAFKGANGSDQYISNIKHYYENHMAWLRILSKPYTSALNVKGTILTGWQRYDHFATLCELLPAAIPSLAVCLNVMKTASITRDQLKEINGLLGCEAPGGIEWTINTKDSAGPSCTYPGHEILEGVYQLKNAWYYADYLESKNALSGWHKDYNMRRRFSQSFRLSYMQDKCEMGLQRLAESERTMRQSLRKYFKEETEVEWLETYITPLKDHLQSKVDLVKNALKQDTWPRRPIHNKSGS